MNENTERALGLATFDEFVRATEADYVKYFKLLMEQLQRLGANSGLGHLTNSIRAGVFRETMRAMRRRADACKTFGEMVSLLDDEIAMRTESALLQIGAQPLYDPLSEAHSRFIRQCEAELLGHKAQWSLVNLRLAVKRAQNQFHQEAIKQAA